MALASIMLGVVLLGAWAAWAMLARVGVYAVSPRARLEVDQTAHVIQVPVAGRVVAAHLALNRRVQAGDVVLELDASDVRLQLHEQQVRSAALAAQLPPLRRQIAAVEQALRQLQPLGQATRAEARARARAAAALARHARRRASRLRQMANQHLVAGFDEEDSMSEAERLRAEADAASRLSERTGLTHVHREIEARAELARLDRDRAVLEEQVATATAATERLAHEITLRTIRAPVAGYLGEVAVLRVGAYVAAGDRVATVVPPGNMRVVAEFAPADIGRIRIGQHAKLRLDGFPWTEFGVVMASVSGVADVVDQGGVRVELAAHLEPHSRIPVRHGLTGTLEIEVDRVSPVTLVFRTVGQQVGRSDNDPPR